MKRKISILLVLAMVLSVLNVGMSVSAAENYKNFLTVTGNSTWTKTNVDGSTITTENGALTIETTSTSLITKAIGAYTTATTISPAYVAQYDVMLDYDNMGAEEKGYAAVQIFDGAYRALISMYKNSISAQNASASCTAESGQWYTITVVAKNGVLDLYRKEAGKPGVGDKLISDMAMIANTSNRGRFYAYTQNGTNITAGFNNIKIDAWSDVEPTVKTTVSSTFIPTDDKWTATASNGLASVSNGVISLKGNNNTTNAPKPNVAVPLSESSYPVVTASYKMVANTNGKLYLRFEDVGYRAFIQLYKDKMQFSAGANAVGVTVSNMPSTVGTQYDIRLEVNSVDHTYSFARKTGNEGYVYIVKDISMQGGMTTTAKKLVFGAENDPVIDVEVSSVKVENRNFVPVYESVYENAMDSSDALSAWTITNSAGGDVEGVEYTAGEGVTLTSDGSTYKPSIAKTGIAEGLPMQVEFDYTLDDFTSNDGFLGVQIWNGKGGRAFVQIPQNAVKAQTVANSQNTMKSYSNFFNTAGDTYRFRIVVDETTYSVYRKASSDATFVPVAENLVLPTGHNTATKNIKFYMEKAGAEITIANIDVAVPKEYAIGEIDTSNGIGVSYVCQSADTEGGKLYVAVYDGECLEYVDIMDVAESYTMENKAYVDYDASGKTVKAFIWRGLAPIASGR